MENWQNYLDKVTSLDEKLNDQLYVTGILGLKIPLNESYPYSLPFREEVLKEHMLYEGLLDSIKQYVKKATGNVKNLVVSIYKAIKDPKKLQSLIIVINKRMRHDYLHSVHKFFQKLGEPAKKAYDLFQGVLTKYDGMQDGWKKIMAGMGLTTLLAFFKEKFNLESITGDEIKEQALSFLKKYFSGGFIETILNKATDIKTYLGFLGSIVGGINFIADALKNATGKFLHAVGGFKEGLNHETLI